MAVGNGTWQRKEQTVGVADPTTMVTWYKLWTLCDGAKHRIVILEFQNVYQIEVNGEVWDEPEMITAATALHRRLESEWQAEVDAAWELQHGSDCEHGYFNAVGCRGCDPDGR